ncbi:hypothetical protein GCM10010193_36440 [Kitasatospora atroaurantiaca]|uniref:Uncharacterized protein n=1 Tax=Kitasatospora atroaurantiaca TaxID=285545 RepID=A0A561ETB0_9ACTN|nr:hypothetical protein [Kitasatospora atroaurantiaca]TWE18811.1 hypothetical protein FB465_3902 [Kitasatospora atroaurantiaca]
MPPTAPHSVTVRTDDARAGAVEPIGVARLLAQLPPCWRTDFRAAGGGRVELYGLAPDEAALREAVERALADPALRAWRLCSTGL